MDIKGWWLGLIQTVNVIITWYGCSRLTARCCYGIASSTSHLNTDLAIGPLSLAMLGILVLWKFDWLIDGILALDAVHSYTAHTNSTGLIWMDTGPDIRGQYWVIRQRKLSHDNIAVIGVEDSVKTYDWVKIWQKTMLAISHIRISPYSKMKYAIKIVGHHGAGL